MTWRMIVFSEVTCFLPSASVVVVVVTWYHVP